MRGDIKTNSSDFLVAPWQCYSMKPSSAALELWTVQFAVEWPWIDTLVQLVITERSLAALIAVTASLRIYLHAVVCLSLYVYVRAWDQSLLQLMNHRLMSTLISHISHPYGIESTLTLSQETR